MSRALGSPHRNLVEFIFGGRRRRDEEILWIMMKFGEFVVARTGIVLGSRKFNEFP